MSQNVGEIDLSLILNSDKFKSQLKNIDKQADSAASKISSSLSKIGKAVVAAFAVDKIIKFGKTCLDVATETSNAWIGLNSILTGQGKSFDKAKAFIQDYVADGLVPLNNAVAAYKNLTLRGYNTEQIQKTMNALKNSATFARQSTYSLGDAVQTATEGLKNENSVVVDNAGVTKNVAKMWEEYAVKIGKTRDSLTQAEKIQAEVNGILEETTFQMHDAEIYMQTYSGKVAQLSSAFTNMKVAIGNVIQPIAKLFIPIITSAVNAVTKLFTAISGLLALFGLKADSVETVSKGIGDVADSANSASDGISGIGESSKKTAKQLKKSLAGFDEINKLDDNSDSSSGSGSGSGGGAGAVTPDLDLTEPTNKFQELAENMNATLEKIFDPIKKAWENVGQEVIDSWYNALDGIKSLIIAIGKSFAEIWTNGTAQTTFELLFKILADILNIIGNMSRAFANAWEEGGKGTAIIQHLANAFNNVLAIIEGILRTSAEWWKTDKAQMFANAVVGIFEIISGWIEKVTAKLKEVWNNGGKYAFMQLLDFGSNVVQILGKIFEALNPVITVIINLAGDVLNGLLTVIGKVLEVLNHIADWLLEHDGVIQGITYTVLGFMAAWKATELLAFIQTSGGVIAALTNITTAIFGGIAAKIADKAETMALTIMYAKDFIVSIASGTAALIKQAAQWVINTALKVAETAATIAYNVATTAATAVTWLFNAALAVLTSPITLVVAAIAGLIAIIVLLVKNWDTVSEALVKGWEFIKQKATEIFTAIGETLSNIWNSIKETATMIWDAIKAFLSILWEAIKNEIQNQWNAMKTIITTVINAIKTVITTGFNAIKSIISTVLNVIKTVATTIWNGIKDLITGVLNTIKSVVSNVWNNIKSTISNVLNAIRSTVSNIWNNITSTISNAMNNMRNCVSNGLSAISSAFSNVFNGIWNTIRNIANSILGGIESMVNGIIRGINTMLNAFNKLKINIPDWVPGMGGKQLGFNIPNIGGVSLPRLATGAYVKANTPQLAVVGDNKTQGEYVLPEDKLASFGLSLLKAFKSQENNSVDNDNEPININLILDSEVIQRVQVKRSDRRILATNGRCS